jgi:hypothetical protein
MSMGLTLNQQIFEVHPSLRRAWIDANVAQRQQNPIDFDYNFVPTLKFMCSIIVHHASL